MRGGATVAFHDLAPKLESFRDAVLDGLSHAPKRIPCRFLYDERGSDLFEAICETPEYYPTRTEIDILARHAGEIAQAIGPDATIIEFGSGAGQKVKLLLRALTRPFAYVGIEVSREILMRATEDLALDMRELNVFAICADFLKPIALPAELVAGAGRRVAFFPGSSIGNFTPAEATRFLVQCRATIGRGGAMLIGVDLKKDAA
ncbi:MAG: L-histidine N(alpha)-methyltransferase, partial [Stellaceae bacterium]